MTIIEELAFLSVVERRMFKPVREAAKKVAEFVYGLPERAMNEDFECNVDDATRLAVDNVVWVPIGTLVQNAISLQPPGICERIDDGMGATAWNMHVRLLHQVSYFLGQLVYDEVRAPAVQCAKQAAADTVRRKALSIWGETDGRVHEHSRHVVAWARHNSFLSVE